MRAIVGLGVSEDGGCGSGVGGDGAVVGGESSTSDRKKLSKRG